MATFSTYHPTINYTGGSWVSLSRYYLERQSVRTSSFIQYDLALSGAPLTTSHGVTFHADSTGILLDVNFGNDVNSDPHTFSGGGNTNVSSGYVTAGNSISLYNANGGLDAQFTVPDFGYSAGTSGGGGGFLAESSSESESDDEEPPPKVFHNFW